MKKIILGIVLICLFSVVVLFVVSQSRNKPNETIEETITASIIKSAPHLTDNGEPVFDISSVINPQNNWYIATIHSKRDSHKLVPVRVILLDSGSFLKVILGPDNHFSESTLLTSAIPDSVIIELRKS